MPALVLLIATLAADLRPGMELVYASAGRDQAPWVVEVLERGLPLKDGADCARLGIRRQPARTDADESRLCVEGLTLYAWDETTRGWVPQRPVGPDMQLTLPRPNGDQVRYETGAVGEETIGARRIEVVATTVTTLDASGRPKRRLRERYAVGLATATGGVFEVPDASAPDGWRAEQTFELRTIR